MVIKLLHKIISLKCLPLLCLMAYISIFVYISYMFHNVCNVDGYDIFADLAVNITVGNETYYNHEVKNLLPIWAFPLLFIKPIVLGFGFGLLYGKN